MYWDHLYIVLSKIIKVQTCLQVPARIYLFKVNNGNPRTMSEIFSRLKMLFPIHLSAMEVFSKVAKINISNNDE